MLNILLATNVRAWRNADQYLAMRGSTLRPVFIAVNSRQTQSRHVV